MSESGKKILVLIVAYNAERTINSVLKRIPVAQLPEGTDVLVIDDSSADKTFQTALAGTVETPPLRVTVLRNPVNQGYGGNQKIGYEYAIQNGFDVVALLHGDGQYAPEKLPDLISPVLRGEADACFGSRMMIRGEALKRGMPLYKYVGNRILTTFQNLVLGTTLSEFHSGYRVYAVDALKKIPFRYNTNDFHFDTEIIIQFVTKGLRIAEVPIPTYYGDEICYVNGLSYAWNVVKATVASRVHRMGLLYQRKFDVSGGLPLYEVKLGYQSSHSMAIGAVNAGSSVLDLACGGGYVAKELAKKGCRVTGIDKQEVKPGTFDRFVLHDLDRSDLPVGIGVYDYILALDCLEHLDSPEILLDALRRKCFSEKTRLVITVPNIGFLVTRFGLLFGQFNYGTQGILDLTHRRLFTFRALFRMLEQQGYRVLRMKGIPAPIPRALGNSAFSRMLMGLNRFLIVLWRGMFSYQIYVEALFVPPVDRLLAKTIEASSALAGKDTGNAG